MSDLDMKNIHPEYLSIFLANKPVSERIYAETQDSQVSLETQDLPKAA